MTKEKQSKKGICKGKLGKTVSILISIIVIEVLIVIVALYSSVNSSGISYLTIVGGKKLTSDSFVDIFEKKKFTVIDNLDEHTALAISDKYQVTFMYYDTVKETEKKVKKEKKYYTEIKKYEKLNCLMYESESNNVYTVIAQRKNTYILINTYAKYKKEIVKLLKSINYYCK